MELSKAVGAALKEVRESKGLTQEDFVGVSGRTYLSEIERGLKSPTLEKLDQLATHMGLHPLELLVACYAKQASVSPQAVLLLLQSKVPHPSGSTGPPLAAQQRGVRDTAQTPDADLPVVKTGRSAIK